MGLLIFGIVLVTMEVVLALVPFFFSFIMLMVVYFLQQDILKAYRRVFVEQIMPSILDKFLPGFYYEPEPELEYIFDRWPDLDQRFKARTFLARHLFKGTIGGLETELFWSTIKPRVRDEDYQSDREEDEVFRGLIVVIDSLPDHFSMAVFDKQTLEQAGQIVEQHWDATLHKQVEPDGKLVLILDIYGDFMKLKLWDRRDFLKSFPLKEYYKQLYYSLHVVEVLADELTNNN